MEDKINVLTCPYCGFSFKAPFAFMYVDVKEGFAVWWEPQHDPGVDSDAQGYRKMFGANSYYAKAPRIADWEEFKQVILEYYQGKRVGGKIEKMDIGALKNHAQSQHKKSGCMGVMLAMLLTPLSLILLLQLFH
jgi:hypothetical protein